MWENDLSKLTPVPQDLLLQDQELRTQLGTPDLRYMLVVEAPDDEAALRTTGTARLHGCANWSQRGVITGYDHAARYIPTRERQLERQRDCRRGHTARQRLTAALAGTPFRADVFEPFVEDVHTRAHCRH